MNAKVTIFGQLKSKKNTKQIFKNPKTGKSFIASSNASKASDASLDVQLRSFSNKTIWREMIKGKSKPYHIWFKIYRESYRAFDYINIIQGLLDRMQANGWLEDDDMNNIIPYFYPYDKDAKNPRVEITIP